MLDEIERDFNEAVTAGNYIIDITDQLNEKLAKFENYVEEIDRILDDEIQFLIHLETERVAKDAQSSGETAISFLVVAGIMIFSIVVVMGWYVSGSITAATNRLTEGAEQFSRGNLDYRINAMKDDELDMLARSFNKMADVRRRTEKQIVASMEALEHSNQELDDFAYIASHDLKEPLRGIANYSQFLLEDYEDKLDDDGISKLKTLTILAGRMDNLIETLLTYSRVGRVDLARGEIDLNQIVQEVLATLEIRLKEECVEVRKPRQLPTILCDGARIGEVFRNLITNAMKYNNKDQKWIEIGSEPTEKSDHTLYVRDNGIGIRERHIVDVFKIFKRLHGRDKYGGGTGAGLAIVKKIIDRHNGEIWIESIPGAGTTFYFTLSGEHDYGDNDRYNQEHENDPSGGGQSAGPGGDHSRLPESESCQSHSTV